MLVTRPDDLPIADDAILPRSAVIAIDGPAGSGKSSTAKALAERFGLLYIDTGAMYRALTQAALAACTDIDDEAALAALAAGAALDLRPGKGETTVLWNGRDVSRAIRTPEVEAAVSRVSSHPEVRRLMVERQQRLGRAGGVVMEGRDIGSVVFPLATAKIHLSASLEARAERRLRQFRQRGVEVDRDELVRELADRDRQDSERKTSPLMISPDAVVIDSSRLSLDQQNEVCARAALLNPVLDLAMDRELASARREWPWHYNLAYKIFGALAGYYGLKEYGCRGLAAARGCILAVNHISLWDPPLVGSTLRRYPVHTLAKAELFRPDFLFGRLFRWVDSIPIRRKGYDEAAFRAASRALAAGRNLMIFPEGTRRAIGHPGPVRNGLGILVQESRAPVQPVFIRGSYGRRPGGSQQSPLEVCYGPFLRWHGLDALLEQVDRKEASRRIGQLCEAAFREMQARSFERHPQTDFEKELGTRQLKQFEARQKRVFSR